MKADTTPELYLTFQQATAALRNRLGATDREIACWIFFDQIKAYGHVHKLHVPPEINLAGLGLTDWPGASKENPPFIKALVGSFILVADVEGFNPPARYIAFADLVQRWLPHCESQESTANFIYSRIHQSRLHDFAPWLGETELSRVFLPSFPDASASPRPPAEWAMFDLAEVETIEVNDFPSSIDDSARIFKQLDPLDFEHPDVTIERPKPQTQHSSPEYSGIDEAKKEPRTKQLQQEKAIVAAVKSLGYYPQSIPKGKNGTRGVRSEVREQFTIRKGELFGTIRTFNGAWERVRQSGDIKDE